ncbi:MAG: hypothetical protein NT023_11890 [Armatimonadetes bacterium]|nr:hypothetical protein [Armatimonadota bacterium]
MRKLLATLSILSAVVLLSHPAHAQLSKKSELSLSPLETQVLGQRRWLKGSNAALRVIVSNHETGKPQSAKVSVSLLPIAQNGKTRTASLPVYAGETSRLGTLEANFRVPSEAPGAYQLVVNVDSPIGKDEVKQSVQIEESLQLMLTADKPLYQPGQLVHIRTLAMDMATRKPADDFGGRGCERQQSLQEKADSLQVWNRLRRFPTRRRGEYGNVHAPRHSPAVAGREEGARRAIRPSQVQSRPENGEALLSSRRTREGNSQRKLLLR